MLLEFEVETEFAIPDSEIIRAISPAHGRIVYNDMLKMLKEQKHRPDEASTFHDAYACEKRVIIKSTMLGDW